MPRVTAEDACPLRSRVRCRKNPLPMSLAIYKLFSILFVCSGNAETEFVFLVHHIVGIASITSSLRIPVSPSLCFCSSFVVEFSYVVVV